MSDILTALYRFTVCDIRGNGPKAWEMHGKASYRRSVQDDAMCARRRSPTTDREPTESEVTGQLELKVDQSEWMDGMEGMEGQINGMDVIKLDLCLHLQLVLIAKKFWHSRRQNSHSPKMAMF